jgi:hypothetical protein
LIEEQFVAQIEVQLYPYILKFYHIWLAHARFKFLGNRFNIGRSFDVLEE